jgi:pyruvate dehydrogenase E1 component
MDATAAERTNMLNPGKTVTPYISKVLDKEEGVFIAASDYLKALPATITKWIPGEFYFLGTDGFGRSDGRDQLRDFFEVDHRYIVIATLNALAKEKKIKVDVVEKAIKDFELDKKKPNPVNV